MYAFMTHCDVCLRIGEPLGGARFRNGSNGTKMYERPDVGSIDDRRESVYHIVSYCTFVYLLFAFF